MISGYLRNGPRHIRQMQVGGKLNKRYKQKWGCLLMKVDDGQRRSDETEQIQKADPKHSSNKVEGIL